MFILTSSTLTIEPADAHLIGAVGNMPLGRLSALSIEHRQPTVFTFFISNKKGLLFSLRGVHYYFFFGTIGVYA